MNAPSASAERDRGASAPSTIRCWQCSAAHAASLFCPACNAIQPIPPQADHFTVLGIDRALVIDADALQRRYFELSRRMHPDLFQTSHASARIASLSNTALLNRAYRTLRDPVERGMYWLSLQGEALGSNNNQVPRELAMLVFEVQEKLEALRDADGDSGPLAAEVRQVRAGLIEQRDAQLAALERNFARWDAAAGNAADLTLELKTILSAIKYLRTLIRDVDKELER